MWMAVAGYADCPALSLYTQSSGIGVDGCRPTCCASAAAEAHHIIGTISRAEGGQLQAQHVGPRIGGAALSTELPAPVASSVVSQASYSTIADSNWPMIAACC